MANNALIPVLKAVSSPTLNANLVVVNVTLATSQLSTVQAVKMECWLISEYVSIAVPPINTSMVVHAITVQVTAYNASEEETIV